MSDSKIRVSRRDMLRGAGAAAILGSVAVGQEPKTVAGLRSVGPGAVELVLEVNGKKRKTQVEPRTTLLDCLRDRVGLTGTKRICDRGACGGCTVFLDGKRVNSCMLLAVDARGRRITTIEGLAVGDKLHPVQAAFVKHDALQCGFCTPGMVMACVSVLREHPKPTEEQIREGISGNLCRCGTYGHIFAAVREVSR